MELKDIRNYLDEFDNALFNILLHRMSLIPLVASTKLRDEIEIYQPEREKEMFKRIEDFCEKSGFNKELLEGIYRKIIDEAYNIEERVLNNNLVLADEVVLADNVGDFFEKVVNINKMVKEIGNLKIEDITLHYTNVMNGKNS